MQRIASEGRLAGSAEEGGAGLFAATVFLSAFLLFLVQPLVAKFVLPWLGGSSAVWLTSLAFYQLALVVGYGIAHLIARGAVQWQPMVYAGLLLVSLLAMPLRPQAAAADPGSPTLSLLVILTLAVALPYVTLAASGPLLQRWYAVRFPARPPYRLYALSNFGSMLALLAYPLAIEPFIGREHQALAWTAGYAALLVLAASCAVLARRSPSARATPGAVAGPPIARARILLWAALAAAPTAVLVTATAQLTRDVVMPLLWVLPLALYLLSFIVCFDSDRWYRRSVAIAGLFFAAMLGNVARVAGPAAPVWAMIGAFGGLVFFAGLVCHGELARRRPPREALTLYYLTITIGGAAGGLATAIVAPKLLAVDWEFEVALVGVWALVAVTQLPLLAARGRPPIWLTAMIALGLVVPPAIAAMTWPAGQLHVERSFYGALIVTRSDIDGVEARELRNGRILHGLQFVEPARRRETTAYYGPGSGIERALALHPARREGQPLSVGVVGLGVGTIASLMRPGDRLVFYELDPRVEVVARQYFSFLEDSPAEIEVLQGDARTVMMSQVRDGATAVYDLIAVDAFTSDAIPAHLLTRESADAYARLLRPGGVLAFHVSSRFVNLVPVVEGIARHLGARVWWVRSGTDESAGLSSAVWGLIAADEPTIEALRPIADSEGDLAVPEPIGWTDDLNSILPLLRLW